MGQSELGAPDFSQQAKVREIVPIKAPYLSIERLCLFIEETCAAIVDYELARGSPVSIETAKAKLSNVMKAADDLDRSTRSRRRSRPLVYCSRSGWVMGQSELELELSQQAKVREIVLRKAPYLSIERLCS